MLKKPSLGRGLFRLALALGMLAALLWTSAAPGSRSVAMDDCYYYGDAGQYQDVNFAYTSCVEDCNASQTDCINNGGTNCGTIGTRCRLSCRASYCNRDGSEPPQPYQP
ncbi:MAG TPA: hypothetical protein VF736_18270 [Pyrinomonadaceae bacterium]|jgi:hypothetical protein